MAKKQKEEKVSNIKTYDNVKELVDIIALEKPPSQKPDKFTGMLLTDKIERTERGIRIFIRTDEDKEYPVNMSKPDVVALYENKFFGKKVTATKPEEGRSWTIELA